MSANQPIDAGAQFVVSPYPFIRSSVALVGEDGPYMVHGWTPGTHNQQDFPTMENPRADGEGRQHFVVVTVCPLPGRYQDRVFYTRQWEDPDGKVFGKVHVRICGVRKFTEMLHGYRYPYVLPVQAPLWEAQQAAYDAALRASYAQEVQYAR